VENILRAEKAGWSVVRAGQAGAGAGAQITRLQLNFRAD
jgi:hypothetical protein